MRGPLAAVLSLVIVAVVAWRRRVQVRPLVRVISAIIISALVLPAVLIAFQKTAGDSVGAALVAMLLAALTMLLLASYSMRRLDPGGVPEASAPHAPLRPMPAFGLGLFYSVAGAARAAIFVSFLADICHLPSHPDMEHLGDSPITWSTGGVALLVLAVVVVGPVAEECLFRGALLPWLTTWMKPSPAIFTSALVFGIAHLRQGAGVVIPIVYGLVLGWMRLQTGRLHAGIAIHMFINAVVIIVALLTA